MLFTLRAGVFYGVLVLFTLCIGLPSLLLLPSRRACMLLARLWNQSVLWLLARIVGIRVRIFGEIPAGAAIFASQHQSAIETFALQVALHNPAFILKKELLRIPFFGWILARLAPVAIDRSAGKAAAAQIAEQGLARLKEGRRLVIFPEGTRRPVGAPLKLKSGGIWALYQLGYPVLPVALNTGQFWPKKGLKRAGIAQIHIAPPLPEGLSKDALLEALATAYAGD